jgi:hypothetical protein
MHPITTASALALLGALSTHTLIAPSTSPALQASSHHPPVQYDIYTRPTAATNLDPTAPTWLTSESHAKTVTYRAIHPGGPGFTQEYSTSFWPTCIISRSATEVLVAGKTDRGFTLIESWTFDGLPVMGWTNGQTLGGNPAGSSPTAAFPRVTSKQTVYFNNEPGKDLVKNMVRNRALAGNIFVEFDASEEVWDLDTSTGFVSLVVSPTQAVSPLPVLPELADDQFRFTSSVHHTYGGMYRLARNTGDSIIFTDADNDGALDGVLLMTPALWATMGLSDPAGYSEL